MAFAFLPDQSEAPNQRHLTQIKGLDRLIHPTIALTPEAISPDCDQALRNAISLVLSRAECDEPKLSNRCITRRFC